MSCGESAQDKECGGEEESKNHFMRVGSVRVKCRVCMGFYRPQGAS